MWDSQKQQLSSAKVKKDEDSTVSIGFGTVKIMGNLYKRGFSESMGWAVIGGEKVGTILFVNLVCRELGS